MVEYPLISAYAQTNQPAVEILAELRSIRNPGTSIPDDPSCRQDARKPSRQRLCKKT